MIIKRLFKEEDGISIKSKLSNASKNDIKNGLLIYKHYSPFTTKMAPFQLDKGLQSVRLWKRDIINAQNAEVVLLSKARTT